MTGVSAKQIRRWRKIRESIEDDYTQLWRKRQDGGGRPVLSEELEKRLIEYVRRIRGKKMSVSYMMIKTRALEISRELGLVPFKASLGYIQNFCNRHHLTYRRPTHQAQMSKRTATEDCAQVLAFFNQINSRNDISYRHTFNMDETPMYFDMTSNKTVTNIGAKTVDLLHTGHVKTRFTVVLTITARGDLLPAYLTINTIIIRQI